MTATIIYKSWTNAHGSDSKQYQHCVMYARHKNITVKDVFEITEQNREALLRKIAYEMSDPNSEPHVLIVYTSCDIEIPGETSLFLPLIRMGKLEVHEVWAWRYFNQDSSSMDLWAAFTCAKCKFCHAVQKRHFNFKTAAKPRRK